jgi:hypothetical protein
MMKVLTTNNTPIIVIADMIINRDRTLSSQILHGILPDAVDDPDVRDLRAARLWRRSLLDEPGKHPHSLL